MKADVASLMEKAGRSLAAAKLLLDEDDADFAASRTYYAVFYAAEALLLSRGLTFSKHSAVISDFGKHFVKSGLFDQRRHADLRLAFDERNIGDYGYETPFPASAASELLCKARELEGFLRREREEEACTTLSNSTSKRDQTFHPRTTASEERCRTRTRE